MTYDNHNATNIQYFTDWRFGRHDCEDQYYNGNNTHNCYNNNNSYKPWRRKCYVYGEKGCRSSKHSDDEQQKAKELWRQNQEFREDKSRYNVFLADYEGDSNNDIENDNEKVNHLDDNHKDGMQYVIAAHLSNESFMHFLIAQNTLPSNEASTVQYFI